jgi:hypothetical protein
MAAPTHKPFRLELSPEGAIHDVMQLYEDLGRNQTAWAMMPPFYWCAAAEEQTATATVLAWNPNLDVRFGRVPLIAFHFAGEGKVLFVGLDSTWHWRQNVGERFFYKFWGQAIRFVARNTEGKPPAGGGDSQETKRNWIEARPIRLEPGQNVTLEAMVFDASGEPLAESILRVNVRGPEASENVSLRRDAAQSGRYSTVFLPKKTGHYSVSYQPNGQDAPIEARFDVAETLEEMRRPNINRPLLQQIAAASGGEMVALWDLAAIPDRLKGETKQTQLHHEATLWDNWLVLLVLIVTYSVDVGLRRMKGLT